MPQYKDGSPMTPEHSEVTEMGGELAGAIMELTRIWAEGHGMDPTNIDGRILMVAFGGAMGSYMYSMEEPKRTDFTRQYFERFIEYSGVKLRVTAIS